MRHQVGQRHVAILRPHLRRQRWQHLLQGPVPGQHAALDQSCDQGDRHGLAVRTRMPAVPGRDQPGLTQPPDAGDHLGFGLEVADDDGCHARGLRPLHSLGEDRRGDRRRCPRRNRSRCGAQSDQDRTSGWGQHMGRIAAGPEAVALRIGHETAPQTKEGPPKGSPPSNSGLVPYSAAGFGA